MKRWIKQGVFRCVAVATVLFFAAGGATGKPPQKGPEPIVLIVMDPLAKELACACVKGFGQRDYRKLAARLESVLKQRVSIEFSDDLADSLEHISGQEVIVVGEESSVAHGAKAAGLKCRAVCELTGVDGSTTLEAVFVARSNDPAKQVQDIAGRTVYVGFSEADGRHGAALAALQGAGLKSPAKTERRIPYNEAALDVLDSSSSPLPVAVIPAYGLRLLEGCGSIKPGDLKVIGRTEPLPFITVFLADAIAPDKAQKITKTLVDIKADAKLLEAMETRDGFRPVQRRTPESPQAEAGAGWPDWRGPGRDGRVPKLPSRLPETTKLVWKRAAMTGGLAGLSVSDGRLILAERDFGDEYDVYRCLNAENGELLWQVEFPARGYLDYGQSPRATPVIHKGRAYLLGAFGGLRCVDAKTGKVIWERQLIEEFRAELPTWGMCSTPLVIDDLVMVNPGSANASLAALDQATGKTRWTTPGLPAAYSAFICGEFGGRRQIVGYDQRSLGGWDPKTGERLWQLTPPLEGDFNVPTPIALNGGIIVSTENNGTRLYRFDDAGRIIPKPAGEFADLAPDTATPVVSGGRVFGTHHGLHCLDAQKDLSRVWYREDDTLGDYSTVIADDERVLVITLGGELILLDARADECTIVSRLRVFEDDVEVYSHPALVGTRLYMRGGSRVVCVELAMN